MGGFSAGFYGMLRFNAFSYLDIVDTRLQETPDSEYPNCMYGGVGKKYIYLE